MRRLALIAGLLLGIFVYLNSGSTVSAQSANTNNKKKESKVVKVQSGDSLSKIAKKHKSSFKRIYFANKKIKDPNLIFPGDKLRIPSREEKLKPRPMHGQVIAIAKPSSSTVSVQKPAPVPQTNVGGGVWDRLASCESGGNWSINTGNGYYGGLQFSLSSWQGVGGSGYPHQASKAEQIKRAEILRASGGWGHWPACSAQLGLL